jgi:hypothetical protein
MKAFVKSFLWIMLVLAFWVIFPERGHAQGCNGGYGGYGYAPQFYPPQFYPQRSGELVLDFQRRGVFGQPRESLRLRADERSFQGGYGGGYGPYGYGYPYGGGGYGRPFVEDAYYGGNGYGNGYAGGYAYPAGRSPY